MVMFNRDGILYRYVDNNGDGDFHDVGEQNVFYSTGTIGQEIKWVLVLDRSTLLMQVNYSDPGYHCQIELLQDHNGDGDAGESGERTTFFSGPLANGQPISRAFPFARDETGAIYILETPQTVSWSVTRLVDLDTDGDTDDSGESTRLLTLPYVGGDPVALLDSRHRIWFTFEPGPHDMYRVDGTSVVKVLGDREVATQTDQEVRSTGVYFLLPGDELGFAGVVEPLFDFRLFAWNDNGDDVFAKNELAALWNVPNALPGTGFTFALEDHSLLIQRNGVSRVADVDGDAAFSGDETRIVYDREIAKMNGHADVVPIVGTTR
jgi:hypothetical protein